MGQKAKRPRRAKPQRRGEERRPRSIGSPPPAPPRPLPPFAIARNEKRPSSLRLPSPPLELEDVGKSRKRKTLNAFENIMNPLESLLRKLLQGLPRQVGQLKARRGDRV